MADQDSPGIKVTDRRMFTETGELRDGYLAEDDEETSSPDEPPARPASPPSSPESRSPAGQSQPARPAPSPGATRAATNLRTGDTGGISEPPPGYGENHRRPQFLDLVAMLAEPAALFLGDATIPGQEPMEDLERARMHIDLLGLLEEKCQGNLNDQESVVLSDLVYRLRLRYVEKRG